MGAQGVIYCRGGSPPGCAGAGMLPAVCPVPSTEGVLSRCLWDRRIKNGVNEGSEGFPLEAESLAAGGEGSGGRAGCPCPNPDTARRIHASPFFLAPRHRGAEQRLLRVGDKTCRLEPSSGREASWPASCGPCWLPSSCCLW